MDRLNVVVKVTLASLVVASSAFAGQKDAEAKANVEKVKVVNSPAESVPVKGTVGLAPGSTVGVSGTVTIANPITIANPVSLAPNTAVAIQGTPTVNVANFPTSTGSADLGQRYAETVAANAATTPVPSGKRLILSHFSATASVAAGFPPWTLMRVSASAGQLSPQLALTQAPVYAFGNQAWYAGSMQVDVIIDAGGTATCEMSVGFVHLADQDGSCSFFGRLVDAL